ncbi:hypothetical protein L596_010678 [Steinernema carpocapsae]|uniref:Uncharacterized protein n=1 Tax=Steinernema carpocapsae TaxID=34508 RepID=A0A4V6A6Y9_STECR|nr:hypothetical protein L596_010678 [Steinernema carpocapsae]
MSLQKAVGGAAWKRSKESAPSSSGTATESDDDLYGVAELKAHLIEAERALGALNSDIHTLKNAIRPGMMPNLPAFEKDVAVMMKSIEGLLGRVRVARRQNCGFSWLTGHLFWSVFGIPEVLFWLCI